MLLIAALVLLIAYVMLPRILLGSAYADMRLAPYVMMIALIAVTPVAAGGRVATVLAIGGALFFGVRTAGTIWSFVEHDRAFDAQLKALDVVEPGARIMVLVNVNCVGQWRTTRMDHLGSQAIVRRDAFVNGQWVMPGAQLLSVIYKPAGRFADRSVAVAAAAIVPGAQRADLRGYGGKFSARRVRLFLADRPAARALAARAGSCVAPVVAWRSARRALSRRPQAPRPTRASETPKGSERRADPVTLGAEQGLEDRVDRRGRHRIVAAFALEQLAGGARRDDERKQHGVEMGEVADAVAVRLEHRAQRFARCSGAGGGGRRRARSTATGSPAP